MKQNLIQGQMTEVQKQLVSLQKNPEQEVIIHLQLYRSYQDAQNRCNVNMNIGDNGILSLTGKNS